MTTKIHIIGSGLSGLSAAVQLAKVGVEVRLYEATSKAGGRCRSYFDKKLGQVIDNGNHLVLSGNKFVSRYLREIGSINSLWLPERAEYPFLDLESGEKWTIRPDISPIPWSLLLPSRRVPGSSICEYFRVFKLAWANDQTVFQCLNGPGPLFRKFWEPLSTSVLNTEAKLASAKLLWPVVKQTFGKGESACRPMLAKQGLSETFVDPAIRFVEERRGSIKFNSRLISVIFHEDRVIGLEFSGNKIDVKNGEGVVLALPLNFSQFCMPRLIGPTQFMPIVNGHFCLPKNFQTPCLIGLVGGIGHWIFVRNNIASITVSAATSTSLYNGKELAQALWPEICLALELGKVAIGNYRILKEKKATYIQSPSQISMRPRHRTRWANMVLAGDWVETGLPATIEGSLKSGNIASECILSSL